MWSAAPPPPAPSSGPRRKGPKTGAASAPSPSSPAALVSPTASLHHHHPSTIVDLLEPAIDGPPSPESIRALSKQMKRASFLEKHQSQQTTSSGSSSSLRSLASADRPSWEHAMDEADLSRKSSGRSTASSMQRRERPDSVQLFGKTIFGRRGRIKRDSGAQSSSSSSMYSNEMSLETGLPPTSAPPSLDTFIPAFFNRRRMPKTEHEAEESAARRKFQISGPYNFQHLTHTQRDQVPDLQRSSRAALQSEFSVMRASQLPSDGALRGIQADNLHFADFSSETLPLAEESSGLGEPHTRISLSRPVVLRTHSSPRRLQRSRSQEMPGAPPPRPPRSPVESTFVEPPVPPPRISSRVSIRYDNFDPLASTILARPQTSGGFRHPSPLALPGGVSPARGHSYSRSTDLDVPAEHRYSRLMPTLDDDSNWPLPCPATSPFDKALPDVPEEEEHFARKSRVSMVSNNSSLRGSQSVPLLRQAAQAQSFLPPRPLSGGSDTLGRVEMLHAQKALRAALQEKDGPDTLPRESWEDDIDYCYDHAAEADCEYAWDRPSLDLTRESEDEGTPVEMAFARSPNTVGASPSMLTTAHFDMPALSPASQVSTASAHEAVTPTAAAIPRSNFSLPRMDARHSRNSRQFLHARTASHASSFKESHGFNLSPSLLIPGSDYHRHMMAHETDDLSPHEEFPAYDEPTLTMDPAAMFPRARTSASTTGSNGSERSGSERHISTMSASTDMTRLTADIEEAAPKAEAAAASKTSEAEPSHVRGKSEPMAVLLEEPPESPVLFRNFSRNSEPKVLRKTKDEGTAKAAKTKEPKESFFRRQRSKTTGGASAVVTLPVANSLFWGP